ncbi:hypothetical protein TNCV_481311 [Trichonephila clavipes]|nr:hypothetical protein TNCV_481311 [Trichonephila clavipes]
MRTNLPIDNNTEDGIEVINLNTRVIQGTMYTVTIIIMIPDDDVGDGERMVLLPEIVGEKGFLESISPMFRDRLL